MTIKLFLVFFLNSLLNSVISQEYSVSTIPSELIDQSNAVIRWESCVVQVESINSVTETYDLAVTVMNASGREFNSVGSWYTPDMKLKCEVIIYDSSGNEIKKIKQKEFQDQSLDQGYDISKSRILYYNYTPTSYPYTIYFHYEVKSSNTAFLPKFRPQYTEYTSIEKSEYHIINNSTIPLKHKIYNPYNYPIYTEETSDNDIKLSISNLPAFVEEPYTLDFDDIFPTAKFTLEEFNLEGSKGNTKSWQEFGKWMYDDFLQPTSSLTTEMKSKFQEITQSAHSDEEKISQLYEFLQNNMRYVSVQLGIGGWKPMMPESVYKNKYGDCKALSNFMKNALESVGIESNYTVLYSDPDFKSFDPEFPIMEGNHVILNIPLEEQTIWLECTSKDLAYNYMPTGNDNRNVLSVNKNGGTIVHTPKLDSQFNQEIIDAQLQLYPNGNLTAVANLKYTGSQYEHNVGLRYKNNAKLNEYYREKFYEIPGANIQSTDFVNDKFKAEFSENISFECASFAKKIGNDLLFEALPFGKLSNSLSLTNNRKLPFVIQRGLQDDFTFVYQLPEEYGWVEFPENKHIEHPKFGRYDLNFEQKENTLIVHRVLLIQDGEFEKDEYNEYVLFKNKIIEYDHTKLLIQKL